MSSSNFPHLVRANCSSMENTRPTSLCSDSEVDTFSSHTHRHTHIHTHTSTHRHIHTDTHRHTHIHTHPHIHTVSHIDTHIHTYIHTYTQSHTQTHTHIHTHAHINTHRHEDASTQHIHRTGTMTSRTSLPLTKCTVFSTAWTSALAGSPHSSPAFIPNTQSQSCTPGRRLQAEAQLGAAGQQGQAGPTPVPGGKLESCGKPSAFPLSLNPEVQGGVAPACPPAARHSHKAQGHIHTRPHTGPEVLLLQNALSLSVCSACENCTPGRVLQISLP